MSVPLNQGLLSCIKIFWPLESLHMYHKNHLNTKTITNIDINFTCFTISRFIFLADWRVHIWYTRVSEFPHQLRCWAGHNLQQGWWVQGGWFSTYWQSNWSNQQDRVDSRMCIVCGDWGVWPLS